MLLSQYSNCPDPFLAEMAGWLVVPRGQSSPPEFQPSLPRWTTRFGRCLYKSGDAIQHCSISRALCRAILYPSSAAFAVQTKIGDRDGRDAVSKLHNVLLRRTTEHGCKCATCVRVWSTRVCIVPCVILHVGPHAIAGSRRKTFTRGRKNRMEHTDSCRFILATGKKTTAFESFREGRHDGNESDFVIETIKS